MFLFCPRCKKETKPTLEFYYASQLAGSSSNIWCRVCLTSYNRENKHKYRERDRAYSKEYRRLNPEICKLADRNCRLRKNYGITIEEFDQMVEDQNGCCIICHEFTDKLRVDHDHETGEIRGLLCNLCNVGLGAFQDNIESLLNAIKYLTTK